MNLDSADDSNLLRLAAGAVLLIICLATAFSLALDRIFSKVSKSLVSSFAAVEHADDIVDDLDRLRIDQRAFLSTGEDCYSEDIIESATQIISHIDALEQLPVHGQALSRQIARLSDSVHSALNVVGLSNNLQQDWGTAAALALLDRDGYNAIETARMDAVEVRRLATDRAMHRVSVDRKPRSVLGTLF